MNENIGAKIKELRQAKSMSLNDLGVLSGVSKQSIHRYEDGEKYPSSLTLLNISKALKVHPSYFFQNDLIDIKIAELNFREEEAISQRYSTKFKNELVSFCKEHLMGLFELKSILGEGYDFTNPLEGLLISTKKDVEKAAKNLRKKWGLGDAPISDVTSLVESKGLSIIEIEIAEEFTGLSGIANDEIPFIVINKNCKDITRKRFTTLHELGHIVLEFAEYLEKDIIEQLCHHFAGAVLLVDEKLIDELGKGRTTISLNELKALKEKYGMSIKAIIMRAKVTGYISEQTSKNWWDSYMEWYSNSDSMDFGSFEGREHAVMFNNLVMRGIQEQKITWGKAAELKNMKVDVLKAEFNQLEFTVA